MSDSPRAFDAPLPEIDGASILVTGGTGSFGQAFVSTVLNRFKPHKLIVFSRDEQKQYQMARRFDDRNHPCMRYFIGDVRDVDRLEMAMRDVDIVVHAAALKHVPAAEYNPFECIMTNIHGAENVVKASLRTQVQRVVALSTDKAASPINLYGASKLASDKIFVAANNLSGGDGARFSVVRYGNVLGSRGSVLPLFRSLKASGADHLPITDPRMTRFWITLEQGVAFVLSSLSMMKGGEIFVPKIASSLVTDLASVVAPDLPIRNVGIRIGEKLHEVMITEDDARATLELDDRFIICPGYDNWSSEAYQEISARKVGEGFRYASNQNSDVLNADALGALVALSDTHYSA
ncbi:MAG: UDP-N-acetylglucosamine 4,6-dehydratase (inverting) [Rhodospirillaceae bacterium]|nr:UDP-N-acetylglucosamine 4,6-dehydratase (inverting) [Rhodospirillaceae bacterium]